MPKTTPGLKQLGPDSWLVQVCANGNRATRRLRGSRAEAEVVRLQLLESCRSPTEAPPTSPDSPSPEATPSVDVGLTLAKYLRDEWAKHAAIVHKPSTAGVVEASVRYLCYYLGDLPITAITPAVVKDFVRRRLDDGPMSFTQRKDGSLVKPHSEKTSSAGVNRNLKLLRASLRHAQELGLITIAPRIQLLPEDDATPIVPPPDEVLAGILAKAEDYRDRAPLLPEALLLTLETGLRESELFHLTWRSIEWDVGGEGKGLLRVEEQARTRSVHGEKWVPKNRRFRAVPLSRKAVEVLRVIKEKVSSGPLDHVIPNVEGTPYIRLHTACSGAGSNIFRVMKETMGHEVTWRDFRHVFAVRMLQAGVPISTVSHWMGHSSVELTVKRYGRFAEENAIQWIHIERAAKRGGGIGLVAVP